MIFSEIYGSYYNTVAKILKEAIDTPIDRKKIQKIIETTAFAESMIPIETALSTGQWNLLFSDGTTPIQNSPTMPITTLQRRWLKAISLDPRIKLFDVEFEGLDDIEPLFTREDYYIFDQYSDGDPYNDEKYIRYFRMILNAVQNRYPLRIWILSRKRSRIDITVQPEYLEYSEKDDKFRVFVKGNGHISVVNLGRIIYCEKIDGKFSTANNVQAVKTNKALVFELRDERNALERVLLHFSHFEKEAEKLGDDLYKIKVIYDKSDETEMVIRILSFGSKIKVIEPYNFVELIRERLRQQKACGL